MDWTTTTQLRQAYGLSAYDSFDQLTSEVDRREKLELLYGDINNIDLWVGLMAEDHSAGSSVGELTGTIIADQFERLRDGDRFFYENVFSGGGLQQIQQTTLAALIQRNTDVEGLQDNVFVFSAEVSGTVRELRDESLAQPSGGIGLNSDQESRSANVVAGITVELLDDQGSVVDTTVTDGSGDYRFVDFDQTGHYVIQIATNQGLNVVGTGTVAVLVRTGDVRLRGIDFSILV